MSIFYLPDLGEGLSEAEIVEWHVKEGELVAREQLLVSVETAKAVVEIPSPEAGRIVKLCASAGAIVPTGAALVEFAEAAGSTAAAAAKEDAGSVVGTLPGQTRESTDSFIIGRHRHTEARLQQQSQLSRQRREPAPEITQRAEQFAGEPLHGLRRHMAETMARSQREVALVTIFDEAIIPWQGQERPVPRIIRSLCQALTQEPALNAWYDGERKTRLLHNDVHIGIAIDTEAGLVVPTLRLAQTLDATELERRLRQLKVAAVKRSLSLEQLRGATITLSVHGSIGGRFATPLVTPPQVAIVGAGTIYQRLEPDPEHGFRNVSVLPLSLSVDHRVVTGGEAARFLQALIDALERSDAAC